LINKKNQSMLVTGESGAGKTENTKKIISYLTSVAGGQKNSNLSDKILSSNPLLESYGNAKTSRNVNSSRFGKFIELNFDNSNKINGTRIVNYLLETTRIISQLPGQTVKKAERNFHIFYQLLSNKEYKTKYGLNNYKSFKYISNPDANVCEGVNDAEEFQNTLKCMKTLQFTDEEIEFAMMIPAACLHLGQIQITENSKGFAEIQDKEPLKAAAKLLQVSASKLEKSFLKPIYMVMGEKKERELPPQKGIDNKDSFTKSIYSRTFDWIVSKVNETLLSKEKIQNWIGILDIAGFEIFELNSFEQLCINFTNERLQQFFNSHMFKKEQEEYEREKIVWKYIDFGLDLQPTIDLIESDGNKDLPTGILGQIDEQNKLGIDKQDDTVLVKLFQKSHNNNKKFRPDRFDPLIFFLGHYAGEVHYNVTGWIQKNIDPITDDSRLVLGEESKNKILSKLYQEDVKEINSIRESGKKQLKPKTIGNEYKKELDVLIKKLEETDPHFIRCIKPNEEQKPGILQNDSILHQLRCNGVLEGIRISRRGYPGRKLFNDFITRYSLLVGKEELSQQSTLKAKCELIIKKVGLQNPDDYQIGVSKVFFKAGKEAAVEKKREEKISTIIVRIQAAARGYLAQQNYKNLEDRYNAIVMIQNNYRSFQKLSTWPWWNVISKARPLIELWKEQEEKQRLQDSIKS
jgi:myosin heavy chain 9/10/11/14